MTLRLAIALLTCFAELARSRAELWLRDTWRRAREPEHELSKILGQLGPDERRVMLFVARRLLMGQAQYGLLNILRDRRDWKRELGEEAADALVYAACEEVRRDQE